ncbi:EamA family transporter RarD [Jatrophihabitans sp.]|uniref:EamA family transporter RarD n=1 Tax=Jatrophihabitans sp. TaxID=1932789 RepID=UPI0030C6DB5B|nr:EamA family transporter RarD [Jatrophihabitans sp.]
MSAPDEQRKGLGFGAAAYLMWGAFPLFFPLLAPAGTVEILAQRMAWSLIVVLLLLRFGPGFGGVRAILHDRGKFSSLTAAAVLISVNWGVYIYAVNSGHVVEASLGYFINPLVTILLGVVVLHERLRPLQWAAVAIGLVAVVVIAVDYGRLPWIALVLASSFGLYGFIKKGIGVAAVDSLAVETGVLFVPAIIALVIVQVQGNLAFGHSSVGNSLLLASCGVVTAVPLLLFAASAGRLPLSTLGLLQYMTPLLQFVVGVGIRHESVPFSEYVGFGLVWIALTVLSIDGVRYQRRALPDAVALTEAR